MPAGSLADDELATLRSDGGDGNVHLLATGSGSPAGTAAAPRAAMLASHTDTSESRPSATDAMQAITTPRPVKRVLGAVGHGLLRAGRDAVAAAAHLVVR